jgi:hypothetical protein
VLYAVMVIFICEYLRFLTFCGRLACRVPIYSSILVNFCVLEFRLSRCFLKMNFVDVNIS